MVFVTFVSKEEYWIWLSIKEKLEASETFDLKVMSSNGTVLMLMDNVVFRKVLPEQIQMAIAAQSTPEDDAETSIGQKCGSFDMF